MIKFVSISVILLLLYSNIFAASNDNQPIKNKMVQDSLMLIDAGNERIKGVVHLDSEPEEAKAHFIKAISMYDQLLKNNPENTTKIRAIIYRGQTKEDMQKGLGKADLDLAISITSEQIISSPNNSELYYLRGSAYRGLNKYAEARQDLKKAISMNPERTNWQTDLKMMEVESK